MRVASVVSALAISLMLVGSLLAQETKPRPEGRHGPHPMMERGDIIPPEMLKGLNLTDAQKAKLDALKKEYAPKLKECREKVDCVLTEEQKKARQEAMKAAREADKSREEVWKEAQAAVKLTDEQQTKMDAARKEVQAVRKEAREKIMEVLTPEQKEQLKKEREHRRGHGHARPDEK